MQADTTGHAATLYVEGDVLYAAMLADIAQGQPPQAAGRRSARLLRRRLQHPSRMLAGGAGAIPRCASKGRSPATPRRRSTTTAGGPCVTTSGCCPTAAGARRRLLWRRLRQRLAGATQRIWVTSPARGRQNRSSGMRR
jgi:hypothetical protein